MWNRRHSRLGVCDLLCFRERASEPVTEEGAHLRDINTVALSQGGEVNKRRGVIKQVIM
jgi:hypothetical protein